MKNRQKKLTPATALPNEIFANDPGRRMLTEYEIKLLRQSKLEIGEAIRKQPRRRFVALLGMS